MRQKPIRIRLIILLEMAETVPRHVFHTTFLELPISQNCVKLRIPKMKVKFQYLKLRGVRFTRARMDLDELYL